MLHMCLFMRMLIVGHCELDRRNKSLSIYANDSIFVFHGMGPVVLDMKLVPLSLKREKEP